MAQEQRITWIDTIKGICILLLLFSHSQTEFDLLKTWIFSFMLPAFFIVCGYLAYYKYPEGLKPGQLGDFLSKRWYNLFIPYFLFGVIFILYINFIRFISGNPLLLVPQFTRLLSMEGIASMWFLPTYFFSELLFLFFLTIVKGKARLFIVALTVIILSLIEQTTLSWPIDILYRVAEGTAFIYIAFIFASYKIENKISIPVAVILLVIASISTAFNQGASMNDMKIVPLYFINAIIITLSMICLINRVGQKYGDNRMITFYGKNSLIIVCTNNLIIEFLRLLDHKLFNDSLLQIGYLGIIIFFIIITLCEYPLLKLFEGKFNRNYLQGRIKVI